MSSSSSAYLHNDILTGFIESKMVDKDSPEYRDFKERSQLPNWDFSLTRLFIDASCKPLLMTRRFIDGIR